MSIRRRLRLGLVAIGLVLAVFAIAGFAAVSRLGATVATMLSENYASVVACEDMKVALAREDLLVLGAARDARVVDREALTSARSAFEKAFAVEAANITLPGEGELVSEARGRRERYVAAVDAALARSAEARAATVTADLAHRARSLGETIDRILDLNQRAMIDADREGKALARRTEGFAIAAGAVVVLLAAFVAAWLPRLIVEPVDALTVTAEAIGRGDFTVSVPDPEVSELVPLAAAFRRMLQKLRDYRESSLGELLAAKDVARATLECMVDPVVVFDASRAVRYANAAAEAAFGLSAGDASRAAVPPPLAAARDAVLERGESLLPRSLAEAVRWRTPDGDRDYLLRAMPLLSTPPEPPRVIVVAQEVTRLRRIDELKSDMVATVSHQFKTPLTSLRMATHMLLEPSMGELSPSQREIVVTARDETERLRTMVEDLLDVVRIESGAGELSRAPTDVGTFLCGVADAHRTIAKDAGVKLEIEPEIAPGAPVEIDAERLAIAIANLVSNAVRHTPQGGKVRLGASRSETSLVLTVVDDGEGMSKQRVAELLDGSRGAPSANAREDGPTSASPRQGLGLTIAREIVLQHGGELGVKSDLGHGTTFTVTLPLR